MTILKPLLLPSGATPLRALRPRQQMPTGLSAFESCVVWSWLPVTLLGQWHRDQLRMGSKACDPSYRKHVSAAQQKMTPYAEFYSQAFSNSLLAGYAKGLAYSANQYRPTIPILVTSRRSALPRTAPLKLEIEK